MSWTTERAPLLLLAPLPDDGTGRGSGLQVLSHFAFGFRAGSFPLAR